VQPRLCRWPPVSAEHATGLVDFEELRGTECAFIQARRRDRQAERLAGEHGAEISARSQYPPALIKTSSDFRKRIGQIVKASVLWISWRMSCRIFRGAFPGASHGLNFRTIGWLIVQQ
jgi:hypothetical protein